MSFLQDVIESLKVKRQSEVKSTWQTYQSLVDDLAAEKQIDLDQLASTLDALDLSESDLTQAIETKRQRVSQAKLVAELRQVAATIPALESAVESAKNELDAAVAKLRPKVATAQDALNTANQQLLFLNSAERYLLDNVQDPQILEQQKLLDIERETTADDLRLATDEVSDLNARIVNARSKVESLERNLAGSHEDVKPAQRQELRDAKDRLDSAIRNAEPARKQLASLQRQMIELDRRQSELNRRKLLP